MRTVMDAEGFYGMALGGKRLDIGNPRGLIEAAEMMEGA
jgi:UTP-glucose-1-phosphate uridylyltransferase